MSVLGEIECMVGAGIGRLQIPQEGIDRPEPLHLRAAGPTARNGALVRGARGRHRLEAPQPVRDHLRRSGKRVLRPLGDGLLGEWELLRQTSSG